MIFDVRLTQTQWTRLTELLSQQVVVLGHISSVLDQIKDKVQSQDETLDLIQNSVLLLQRTVVNAFRPDKPRILGVTVLSEENTDMAKYCFAFVLEPAVKPLDVEERTLSVTIDGTEFVVEQDPTSTRSSEFVAPLGAAVVAVLKDVDAAGNANSSDPYPWTVVDEVPPAKPGAIGGVLEVGEVDDEVPTGPVVVEG